MIGPVGSTNRTVSIEPIGTSIYLAGWSALQSGEDWNEWGFF